MSSGRDYNRIVYAKNGIDARKAYDELVAKWTPLAPAVVRSLEEAGNQLLTFYEFPRAMWKSIGCRSYIYNGVNNLQAHYRWYVTDYYEDVQRDRNHFPDFRVGKEVDRTPAPRGRPDSDHLCLS